MKVLWVTNTIFPDLSEALGKSRPVVGGWMYGLASDLIKYGVELTVATSQLNGDFYRNSLNGINYYLLKGKKPAIWYDNALEAQWKKVIQEINPDIIHIHGTEYGHGLSLLKSLPNLKYVISIQGLISVYARYYTGHIDSKKIQKHRTLRDIIKQDGILDSQKKFEKRGSLVEKKYFKYNNNFIGRTHWDFTHVMTLNEKANYFFCNESLRDSFYVAPKWNKETKNDYTIFLSQAGYPIKGLHQVIEAVSIIKNEYPDIKLRVAGVDITNTSSLKARMALGGYGNYILSLLKKYDLRGDIEFTGFLDEKQMIEEYLKCHVFVCPSSIENSPNSLGEAQILGTPCISSYVGGVPDMIEHSKTGLLYRFEEVEMLAQSIKSIFDNPSLTKKLSTNGKEVARKRHNKEENTKNLIKIYSSIIG